MQAGTPPLLPISQASTPGSQSRLHGRAGRMGIPTMLPRKAGRSIPLLLKRLKKLSAMDFEMAAWQLTYLLVAPKRVYRNVYHQKQTKNRWARDDPALLILICACLGAVGTAWTLLWSRSFSPFSIIGMILHLIFIEFFLSSLIVSTILYLLSNFLLVPSGAGAAPQHTLSSDSKVEWAFAFDVAVNAFFPAGVVTLGIAQLVLAGAVVRDNWIALCAGNTIYLVAATQYTYGIYLGISALPFVIRSELLLTPLLPIVVGYLLSLLGFNVTKHVLAAFFGTTAVVP